MCQKADMPLSASNLPTAEVNQRPLFVDPKTIEVKPHYAILVTGITIGVQDFILPTKQAEKRPRVPEHWARQALCAAPQVTNPVIV